MAFVVDRLIVDLLFRSDLSGLRRFDAGLRSARRRLDSMALSAATTGAIVSAAGGFAAYQFAQFETLLARTEGLVGINRAQVQGYAEDIKALAPAVGVGPRKIGEALFFATSAGLRGRDVNEALEASAKASAVGLGNQADVVDLVTSAMNAYAHQGLSATQVTDSLTEAVRLGKLEPASLAIAMGQVLPITSALRVEFSEVSALMAAMSRTGTDASKASIQLGQVMNTLLKPTKEAEEGLAAVGLSAEELRQMAGSGHGGLFRTLQVLQTAFDGNNQALVKVFPNIRALRGIFDLLGPSMETNKWIIDEMADSTGILDEAFEVVSRTLAFKFNSALAQAQVILINMGERIAPKVAQGIDLARKAMDLWQNTSDETKDAVARLLLIGPGLLALAVILKGLSTALLPFIWLLSWARNGILALRFGIIGLGLLFKVIGVTIGAIAGVVGSVTGAVVILAIAAALLIALWKPVSTFFMGMWTSLRAGSGEIGEAFSRLGVAGQKFLDALGPVGDVVRDLFTWLGEKLGDQTEAGENFGVVLVNAIVWVIDAIIILLGWLEKVAKFFGGTFDAFGTWADQTFRGGKKFGDDFGKSLDEADDYIPRSDARKGPFSRLTAAGRAIYDTMAAGMQQSPGLQHAFATNVGSLIVPAPQVTVDNYRSGGRGGDIYVNEINVRSDNADPREVAREVAKEVANEVIDERNRKTHEEFSSNVGAS